ncbi:MAG: MATE family efflux transporter [Candidatus Methylacidiphilales bacterium]
MFRDFWRTNKKTVILAIPIMAGQVGQMFLGLADTLMVGRLGTVELAAVAFVNVLINIPIVLGIALSAALSVQVSHLHGEGDAQRTRQVVRNGVLLSVLMGLAMCAGMLVLCPVLGWFRQPPEVLELVPSYLVWVALSLIPMAPSLVLKGFAEARNHPWPVFGIMMGGVVLNVVLNRVLIFGWIGVPAMGLTGAGLATFLARAITLYFLWRYVESSRTLEPGRPLSWRGVLVWKECGSLIRLAFPISGQMMLEFGAFAFATILIGSFGSVALAAHQIAITCAATAFMLPLGLSMALTIRIGNRMGAGDYGVCRELASGTVLMGLAIMSITALLFMGCGRWIASVFSRDLEVVGWAVRLLVVAGVFQLADGLQIISMGGLRGLKDVKMPTVLVGVSYWLIALPLGCWLGFGLKWEAWGLWMGLAAGLACAALMLALRLHRKLRMLEKCTLL